MEKIKFGTFITVPRSLFDDGVFVPESYSRREAFLDLVQMAEDEPKNVPTRGGGTSTIERGQILVSVRFLSARWRWSNAKVAGVLKEYETAGLIERTPGRGNTLISIVDYDFFQKQMVDSKDAKPEEAIKETKEKAPSLTDAVERIYAMYPTSIVRPDGRRCYLKTATKNKEHIKRMLKGKWTEEQLAYAINRYVAENNGPYTKLFETFLNQVPDYSEDNTHGGQQPAVAPQQKTPARQQDKRGFKIVSGGLLDGIEY